MLRDILSTEDDSLTKEGFARLASLVRETTGIRLPPAKRTMLESRLRKRVKRLSLVSLAAYCDYLFEPQHFDAELPHLIDVVTTNKTDFFREHEHFHALERHMIPALLKQRRNEQEPFLKIWSAASSTGAEAYTIAMVMMALKEKGKISRFSVLGTDISTEVLETARAAVYPEEMVDPVPADMKRRYFMVGRTAGTNVVRVVPELRRHVRFQRLNLMDERYPIDTDVDVIFLRNVLIYFDAKDQEAVARRLSRHLRKGGFLVFGHSEAAVGRGLDLTLVSAGVYQKL